MQQLNTEQTDPQNYSPEEYKEVVRRAQQIRAEKEGRISHDLLAESAAEVGIRDEDLREAQRQIETERQARTQRQAKTKKAGAITAAVLGLSLMFSYNSLNTARVGAEQARANLHTTLQRRADVIPPLIKIARESAATNRELVDKLAQAQQGLKSSDMAAQEKAGTEVGRALEAVEKDPALRGSEAYRDLMAQWEGAENRINVARQRYNDAASGYNRTAGGFPMFLVRPLFGMPNRMPFFEAAPEATRPPDFR
jgi:LemA protein